MSKIRTAARRGIAFLLSAALTVSGSGMPVPADELMSEPDDFEGFMEESFPEQEIPDGEDLLPGLTEDALGEQDQPAAANEPEPFEETFEVNGIGITVTADAGVFPEDAVLRVAGIDDDTDDGFHAGFDIPQIRQAAEEALDVSADEALVIRHGLFDFSGTGMYGEAKVEMVPVGAAALREMYPDADITVDVAYWDEEFEEAWVLPVDFDREKDRVTYAVSDTAVYDVVTVVRSPEQTGETGDGEGAETAGNGGMTEAAAEEATEAPGKGRDAAEPAADATPAGSETENVTEAMTETRTEVTTGSGTEAMTEIPDGEEPAADMEDTDEEMAEEASENLTEAVTESAPQMPAADEDGEAAKDLADGETPDGWRTVQANQALFADMAQTGSGQASDCQLGDKTVYELTEDIETLGPILVGEGVETAIDLKGHTIRRVGENTDHGRVMVVNQRGSLTIKDSTVSGTDPDKTGGSVTGGYVSDQDGGGIYVRGTLTLEGGRITGNTAWAGQAYIYGTGGGIYVDAGGSLFMKGGAVSDNSSANEGSGICVAPGGSFEFTAGSVSANKGSGIYVKGSMTMSGGLAAGNEGTGIVCEGTVGISGGSIRDNLAEVGGGIANYGKLTITGGEITRNASSRKIGGGVYHDSEGYTELHLSGAPVITGNEDNNLYLSSGKKMLIDGLFTSEEARIDVSAEGSLETPLTSGFGRLLANASDEKKTEQLSVFSINSGEGNTKLELDDSLELIVVAEKMTEAATWSGLQAAVDQAQDGEVIRLKENITAGSSDSCIRIPEGKKVVIDLSGKMMNRNCSAAAANGSVITVAKDAELSIWDSGGQDQGLIKGGAAANGGGILIYAGGTCYIRGGQISENTAANGGGIMNYGTLDITGGRVWNNTAKDGAGIYNRGTFTASGIFIEDNRSTQNGGGGINNRGSMELVDVHLYNNTGVGKGGAIFNASGNHSVVIDGVVFNGNESGSSGGTICQAGGSMSVKNCELTDGRAKEAGGIMVGSDASFSGENLLIDGCTAAEAGGAIVNNGVLSLADSTIQMNTAKGKGGALYHAGPGQETMLNHVVFERNESEKEGGAVYCKSTLKMENCEVTENKGSRGGGIYCEGTLSLQGGRVEGNTASEGGGIYCEGTVNLDGGRVEDNKASMGAGVCVDAEGTLNTQNAGVTGNKAGADGGGLYIYGTANMTGGSVENNEARNGGGIAVYHLTGEVDNTKGKARLDATRVSISGNSAMRDGGGLYLDSEFFKANVKKFNYSAYIRADLRNAQIKGNTAGNDGGGICVTNGLAVLYGGSVTGNRAFSRGGGILHNRQTENYHASGQKKDPKIAVSGAITVQENTAPRGRNVLLCDDRILTVFGSLKGSQIGVSLYKSFEDTSDPFTEDFGTYHGEAGIDPRDVFTSDERQRVILKTFTKRVSVGGTEIYQKTYSEACLRGSDWPDLQKMIDDAPNGGTVTLDKDWKAVPSDRTLTIREGKRIIIDLKGHTIDRNLAGQTEVSSSVFVVEKGADLTVTDTSATRAGEIKGGYGDTGGGVLVSPGGAFHFNSGTITGCRASTGGGICNRGELTIDGGTVSGNEGSTGGGIYNSAAMTVVSGVISGNSAISILGRGGGIYTTGSGSELTISGGEITSNASSLSGGALYVNEGKVVIDGGSVTGNGAEYYGGAVYVRETSGHSTEVYLNAGTITGNRAGVKGGAVIIYSGRLHVQGAPAVYGNTAPQGKNIFLENDTKLHIDGKLAVDAGGEGEGETGRYARLDVAVSDVDKAMTEGLTAQNGYDSWKDIFTYNEEEAATDKLFIKDDELHFSVNVDKWVSTWQELQNAINDNGNRNRNIGLRCDITASGSDKMLRVDGKTLTIDLNGRTLSRNRDSSDTDGHVFWVTGSSDLTIKDSAGTGAITGGYAKNGGAMDINTNASCTLKGVAVKSNNASDKGGAFRVKGTLTLDGCSVVLNHADDEGGAIYCEEDGTVSMVNTTIAANDSDDGGAIRNLGSVSAENAVITGNTSSDKGAGAISNMGSLTLTGGSVGNNTAKEDGGALYNKSGDHTVTISGTEFTNNTAGREGGAIYVESGNLTLKTAVLAGNQGTSGGAVRLSGGAGLAADGVTFFGNTASKSGGAIFNDGSAVLNGCTVKENTAASDGGGICLNRGTVELKGRTSVCDNSTDGLGGGIYVNKKCGDECLMIRDTPVIEKNIGRNVYLPEGKVITLTRMLGDDASVGVATEKDSLGITLTRNYYYYMNNKDPGLCFFSDDGYDIRLEDFEAQTTFMREEGEQFLPRGDRIETNINRLNGTNWMSGISGERYLSEINIPSTHDSAMKNISARGTWGGIVGEEWAQCQYRYIDEQLQDGIRRLDLRLNNYRCDLDLWGFSDLFDCFEDDGKNLWLVHGKTAMGTYYGQNHNDKDLSLREVLDWVTGFLTRHPTETVILDFCMESQWPENYDEIFDRVRSELWRLTDMKNPSTGESFVYWENGFGKPYTHYPKLKDCRGKIVVQFNSDDPPEDSNPIGGLDFRNAAITPVRWTSGGGPNTVTGGEKVENITIFYQGEGNIDIPTDATRHLDMIYKVGLNSHAQEFDDFLFHEMQPTQLADYVLPRLFKKGGVFDVRGKYLGWVKLDCETERVTRYIWLANFPEEAGESGSSGSSGSSGDEGLQYCTITVKPGLEDDSYSDQSYRVLKGTPILVPGNIYDEAAGTLEGWTVTEPDDTAEFLNPGDSYEVMSDVVFTARWKGESKTSVRVVWQDGDNADNLRPSALKVKLSGEEINVTAENGWEAEAENPAEGILPTAEWEGRILTAEGAERGRDREGQYRYEVSRTENGGFVITLIHTPGRTASFSCKVIWEDEENKDKVRPESVALRLKGGGEAGADLVYDALVSAQNGWYYSFSNVPVYADGLKVSYTLEQDEIPGYTTENEETESGFTITNTHTPRKWYLRGTILWEDDNDAAGKRPESVIVTLLRDGEKLESARVSPDILDRWMFSFEVPEFSFDSGENPYSVVQNMIPQYRTGVTGEEGGSLVITNTFGCEWEFSGFSWTGDGQCGYAAASAVFTCAAHADHHQDTVPVTVSAKTAAPTCESEGKTIFTALLTGRESPDGQEHAESRETDITPALSHEWDEGVTTREADCTRDGVRTYTCLRDPAHKKTVPIAAKGHTAGTPVITVLVPATCTETGTQLVRTDCVVCKENISTIKTAIPALKHELTKTEAAAASCTETGNTAYWTCSVCGKHFADDAGETETGEDSWTLPAKGHTWGAWTAATAPTETTEGEEKRTCGICGAEETRSVPPIAHVHGLTMVSAKAATCTADGNIGYYVCDRAYTGGNTPCGRYYLDAAGTNEISPAGTVIKAPGHDWGEGSVTTPSTCAAEGVLTYTCRHNPSHTKTETIPKRAHTPGEPVRENVVAATCEEPGSCDLVTYCSQCALELGRDDGVVIPAAGHDWVFAGFAWTGSEGSGYTAAAAEYMCGRDADHRTTVPAVLTDTESADGTRTEYTASVDALTSPDGQAHAGVKQAEKRVTVVFYADSMGNTIHEKALVKPGSLLSRSVPEAPEVPEGTTFAGWSYEPDRHQYMKKTGVLHSYVADPYETTVTEDLALYPLFVNDRLNVILVPGDGTANLKDSAGIEQSLDFIVNMNEKLRMEAMNAAVRDGYELDGWYTQGGVKWDPSYGVSSEYCDRDEEGKPILLTNQERRFNYYTVTLTARWQPRSVRVAYTVSGHGEGTAPADGSVLTEQTLTLPGSVDAEGGWRFAGWQDRLGTMHAPGETLGYAEWAGLKEADTEGGSSSLLRFTAVFEELPAYAVIFDTDGGSHVETVVTTAGGKVERPADPTKAGHGFVRWIYQDGQPDAEATFPITVSGTVTVKAVWAKNQYTITFNTNGGGLIDPITEEYGSSISWPTDPIKEHYAFAGWDTGKFAAMPAEDLTVNALWEPVNYKIILDAGEGSFPDGTDKKEISGIYGSPVALTEDHIPVRDGFAFAGWDGPGGDLPAYMPDTGQTYTARWAHVHTLVRYGAVPASCMEDGHIEYYSCEGSDAACQELFADAKGQIPLSGKDVVIKALGHDWDDWQTVDEPVLMQMHVCRRDPQHVEGRDIPLVELTHDWGEWEVKKPATETEEGLEVRVCYDDPTLTQKRPIPRLPHMLTETPAKEAACTEPGHLAYWTCGGCGKIFRDNAGTTETDADAVITAPLGHDYHPVEGSGAEAACTQDGKEADEKCSRCGDIKEGAAIAASGHVPSRSVVRKDVVKPTCTEAGSYVGVTYCSVCGEELFRTEEKLAALDHDWGEWTVSTAASCEKDGEEIRVCRNDPSHKEKRVIPATGHKWGRWEVVKEASGDTPGLEVRYCEHLVNGRHSQIRVIPAGNHTHGLKKVEAAAATCEKSGHIAYWICEEGDDPCYLYFMDQDGTQMINQENTVIEALGHDWDDGEITVQPGCTTEGVRTFTCMREGCGVVKTEAVKTERHVLQWRDEVITDPACERQGYHWHVYGCTKCGETMTRRLVRDEETGHKLKKVEAVESGCTEEGNTEYWICDPEQGGCGKLFADADGTEEITMESTVIPAIGSHDWREWTVTRPATKTGEGERMRVCRRDPAHVETEVIPRLTEVSDRTEQPAASGQPAQPDKPADPSIPVLGEDGTAFGKGANEAALDAAVAAMTSDADPRGTVYGPLRLRLKKATSSSVKVVWNGVAGAKRYIVYANTCGRKTKLKKQKDTTARSFTLKKLSGKKLKKGTYYKFMVAALDENGSVISVSRIIHAATKGGKVGNDRKVTTRAKATKVSVKKGKSFRLGAKTVAFSKTLKVKKHVGIRFETSNPAVAAVTKKGVVKAKGKGSCYVYVYAQDGVFARIRITVP